MVYHAFVGLGPLELGVLFLIILLVFGAKRIPEIAQGLGKGITEFKKAAREIGDELDVSKNPSPPQNTAHNELRSQPQQPQQPQQQQEQQPTQTDHTES